MNILFSDLSTKEQAAYFNHIGRQFYIKKAFAQAFTHFQKAITLQPDLWEAEYNLAHCFAQKEQMKQAAIHYLNVLEKVPHHTNAHFNLGMIYIGEQNYLKAIYHLNKSLECNPNQTDIQQHLSLAFHNAAITCLKNNHYEQALAHFKESLKYQPNNETARYMVAALEGHSNLLEAPPGYVTSLFDQYAEYYDDHINHTLNYQAPRLLYQALLPYLTNASLNQYRILDLGCGTGLCGQYFHDLAKYLVGIDLSANMLKKAQLTRQYDLLLQDNVHAILNYPDLTQQPFDVILAADVLVYIGDLTSLFFKCYQLLSSNSYFGFTIEEGKAVDFQLQPTGRYAHTKQYIQQLAHLCQFHIVLEKNISLRMQQNKPVAGYVFILKKP